MKMLKMDTALAQGFYAVHKERPFFDSLTDFMTSGPVVVMVLEGENAITKYREIMGATDYREAAEGTIRKDFATDIEKNVVHGSDSPETAAFEISYFFNRFELIV
jgi:nucleoside-diphosphate kinase